MTNMIKASYRMFMMDELAAQSTPIHQINPVIKLLLTIEFLLIAISYGKYEVSGLLPLFLYPVILMTAGNIPTKPILGGLAITAPFIVGIGIFNPLLDRTIAFTISGIEVSAGFVSLAALLVKCCLTVWTALLLLATTGINKIAAAMHRLHVPQIFIIQLLLTYRYVSVLLFEASRIYNAYSLRAPQQKGIHSRVWGSLLGQLLLRTYDRALRVYQAMKLRGFESQYYGVQIYPISRRDWTYLLAWTAFFIIVRSFNVSMFLGLLVNEVIK